MDIMLGHVSRQSESWSMGHSRLIVRHTLTPWIAEQWGWSAALGTVAFAGGLLWLWDQGMGCASSLPIPELVGVRGMGGLEFFGRRC